MTKQVGPPEPGGPTAGAWQRKAANRLDQAGHPGAAESRRLLEDVANISASRVLTAPDTIIPPETLATLDNLLEARLRGAPLQYLTRRAAFRHLDLVVGPGVFVPRPETEGLVELVLQELRRRPAGAPNPRILEFGTGSGAILAALLTESPGAGGVGVELSDAALEYARRNLEAVGVTDRSVLLAGDLDAPLAGPEWAVAFDAVVSNPPYIPEGAWESLPRDVRDFEPRTALLGGPDGTDVIRRIVAASPRLLRPGGLLALEIDESHGGRVLEIVGGVGGFEGARIAPDLAGRPRYALARRGDPR